MSNEDQETSPVVHWTREIVESIIEDLREIDPAKDRPAATRTANTLHRLADALRDPVEKAMEDTLQLYRERSLALAEAAERRVSLLENYGRDLYQEAEPAPDSFILTGRVTDKASGVGIPNARIRVVDSHGQETAATGNAHTDALGYFRVPFGPEDLTASVTAGAVTIEALAPNGRRLGIVTGAGRPRKGEAKFVTIEIDGSNAPELVEHGAHLDRAMERRLDRIRSLRRRELSNPAGVSPRAADRKDATPRPELMDIFGIGPANEKRLIESGLSTVEDVASASRAKLAEVLRIGEDRAERMIDDAKSLVRRRR